MAPSRQIRIILNPISGRGQGRHFLDRLVRHLELRAFDVDVATADAPGRSTDLAAEVPDDAHCVVSIGGDGTHREVAAGLLGRPVPLAALPFGTENVLAKTLGVDRTMKATLALIQSRRAVAFDAGVLAGHPFLLFAGVGFDAAVTRAVHETRKGPILRWAYYAVIVRQWVHYPWPPLRVTVDGRVLAEAAGFVFFGNLPQYCDRLRVTPEAVPTDGRLDVVAFHGRTRWQMAAQFARVRARRHLGHPGTAFARGREIKVTCEEGPVPVQIDGDAVAETPLECTVRPGAVRVLVPLRPPR